MKAWLVQGTLTGYVVMEGGNVILCDDCPCDTGTSTSTVEYPHCSQCYGSSGPPAFIVDIPALENVAAPLGCSTCADYAGSYVCYPTALECQWRYGIVDDDRCPKTKDGYPNQMRVEVQLNVGSIDVNIWVTEYVGGVYTTAVRYRWVGSFIGVLDCLSLDDYEVEWFGVTYGSASTGIRCKNDALSSAYVSAV